LKGLYCGSISEKVEGFFERKAERGGLTAGSIFSEFEGSFAKKTGDRPIWAVRMPDRMGEKSGQHGHAGWRFVLSSLCDNSSCTYLIFLALFLTCYASTVVVVQCLCFRMIRSAATWILLRHVTFMQW
jgi:hypothetical protein